MSVSKFFGKDVVCVFFAAVASSCARIALHALQKRKLKKQMHKKFSKNMGILPLYPLTYVLNEAVVECTILPRMSSTALIGLLVVAPIVNSIKPDISMPITFLNAFSISVFTFCLNPYFVTLFKSNFPVWYFTADKPLLVKCIAGCCAGLVTASIQTMFIQTAMQISVKKDSDENKLNVNYFDVFWKGAVDLCVFGMAFALFK